MAVSVVVVDDGIDKRHTPKPRPEATTMPVATKRPRLRVEFLIAL
ncbi:hypothetical protein [Corynebacterium sp. HMSC073D01]|nr:hypothetical protein [Corynebacterium sp. HMSC073D01]EEI28340.1 hypothetical protein HMPREF0294_0104 [Corynebacterium glucuronolyticum ATCC 51867]